AITLTTSPPYPPHRRPPTHVRPLRFRRNRHHHHHHRSASERRRFDSDASALRLDEPPRDRQPEADAAAVRIVRLARRHAEELLEHALAQIDRDSRSFVPHGDPHGLVGL